MIIITKKEFKGSFQDVNVVHRNIGGFFRGWLGRGAEKEWGLGEGRLTVIKDLPRLKQFHTIRPS